jgi:hypothetical protein
MAAPAGIGADALRVVAASSSHVDGASSNGCVVGSGRFPQGLKCTWELAEFWDAELRRGSAPRSSQLMRALVLDACVGGLPLTWLKQNWPTAHEAMLDIVYDSAESLQEKFGYEMAACILYKFRAERGCMMAVGKEGSCEDMQLAADVEQLEAVVLEHTMLAVRAATTAAGSSNAATELRAVSLKRREPAPVFWWDSASSTNKKNRP